MTSIKIQSKYILNNYKGKAFANLKLKFGKNWLTVPLNINMSSKKHLRATKINYGGRYSNANIFRQSNINLRSTNYIVTAKSPYRCSRE